MKRIGDPEFGGWQFMNMSQSGKWIYFSPDNLQAAMVEPTTAEVLFLMDRASGEPIYTSPNVKKHARFARILGELMSLHVKRI
jgi:hypothetical protein